MLPAELNAAWWTETVNKLAPILLQKQKVHLFEDYQLLHFSLEIVDDNKMTDLNKTHRGIDSSTDVLSFPLVIPSNGQPEVELGDIFININRLLLQAKAFGHSCEREGAFLFVHGLLHLMGYDHKSKHEEDEMFAIQDTILLEAGFG